MGGLPGKVLRLDLGEELKVGTPVLHEQFKYTSGGLLRIVCSFGVRVKGWEGRPARQEYAKTHREHHTFGVEKVAKALEGRPLALGSGSSEEVDGDALHEVSPLGGSYGQARIDGLQQVGISHRG
jgi:hypothetical protein